MTLHTTPLPQARRRPLLRSALAVALTVATLASMQGCIALLGVGAVAGGMSLNDRRTGGTQIEDQSIELKSGGRLREAIGEAGHVNVTSYNRIVLLSGEVPSEADKAAAEKAIAGIEGVTNVVNELEVGANSTIDRGSLRDTVIGSGTRIDNLVQVAHNVRIGRNCAIAAQCGIAGSVHIGDFVMLGGQAAIAPHVTVGSRARIAAQSGVMSDIKEGAIVVGSPARPRYEVFREIATLRKLARR